MKHKTLHATLEHGKSLKNILYVWNGMSQNQKISKQTMFEPIGDDTVLLNPTQGKAPPGCSRSPGLGRGHPPENKGDPPVTKTQHCDEYKYINKYQKLIYYKHLILFIMKKQILFLALFSLALIFASSKSYGQYINYVEAASAAAVGCTPALPLTCASAADALHPLPGQVYPYSVTVTPGTFSSIHWFVTDELNVIASQAALTTDIDAVNGSYVLTATPAAYNQPAQTAATLDISWKSFNGTTTPVLLVAYVTGASGCSDNIEVFRIEPTFAFTLDIAGVLFDGTVDTTPEECLSPVESATYNGTTSLVMDYGENWVFFTVNAANFVNSWLPTFTASVTGGSTIGTVEWAYASEAILNAAGVATGDWNAATVPIDASVASGGAVGSGGECVVLRVRVDHGGTELDASAAAAVVTVGVNGVMYNAATSDYSNLALTDLDEPAVAGACVNNITDEETFTLTPRPSLTTTVAVGGFEPKLP